VVSEEKRLKCFLEEIKKQTQICAPDIFPGGEVAQDLAGMKKQLSDIPMLIDRLSREQAERFWDIMDYIDIKMHDLIPQEESWTGSEERFRDRPGITRQETRS